MNSIKSKYLNIVLGIDEGRGFDSIHQNVYLTANFNGRIMETDIVDTQQNIISFNTEMVWETEKKLLRKARSSYSKIRLDCHTIDKKNVGFILLCLRAAQVLPSSNTCLEIPYKWNKLLNVPSKYKKGMPELLISITIRDYLVNKFVPPTIPLHSKKTFGSTAQINQTDEQKIVVKYNSDGYIQVGNDVSHFNKFQLKITVRVAVNFDLLLPESLVFSEQQKRYYLCFDIFGMQVKTRDISKSLHHTVNINETVVINILSSFEIIKLYFEQFPSIPVFFYHDEIALGTSSINLTQLLWQYDKNELMLEHSDKFELEEECIFVGGNFETKYNFIQDTNRKAILTCKIILDLANDEIGQGDKNHGNLSSKVKFSGYQEGEVLIDSTLRKVQGKTINSSLHKIARIESENCDKVKLRKLPQEKVDINQSEESSISVANINDDYQLFCLSIIFESLQWKHSRHFKSNIFQINFIHPTSLTVLNIQADIEPRLNNKLLLDNVLCKIRYVSTPNKIIRSIRNNLPTIRFLDGKEIQLTRDFKPKFDSKFDNNNMELCQLVMVKSIDGKDFAEIGIVLFLENLNLQNTMPKMLFVLEPCILDQSIIFNNLIELSNWKEEIKKKLYAEIKYKQQEDIDLMRKDWLQRKNKLENDLKENIERCKRLFKDLKKHATNIGLDKIMEDRKDVESEKNVIALHKNSVKYSLYETHELMEVITNLEFEYNVLRDLLNERNLEITDMKKNWLSSEQTKNLLENLKELEQKLDVIQADKNYFKSMWDEAVKEVHALKVEKQCYIKNDIQLRREELSQLSLENFFRLTENDYEDKF